MKYDVLPVDMKDIIRKAKVAAKDIRGIRISHLHNLQSEDFWERFEGLEKRLPKKSVRNLFSLIVECSSKASGVTIVSVKKKPATTLVGFSICKSYDQFNKRIGRDIALGNALGKVESVKKSLRKEGLSI